MSSPDLPSPAPPATPTQAEILLVDDDPKTLLAMEAMLADLGASLVTARNGRDALLKLLSRRLCGHPARRADAGARRLRDRAAHPRARQEPPHADHLPDRVQPERPRRCCAATALGAVDFLFKPIVPEILRSKVQVFVELQRKTHEVRRQARLIREAEAREHARGSSEERQRWEADNLRAQMEQERAIAGEMGAQGRRAGARGRRARRGGAGAGAVERAAGAFVGHGQSAALTGHRPHALLGELFDRLTGHLDLDLYAYRAARGRRHLADAASAGRHRPTSSP